MKKILLLPALLLLSGCTLGSSRYSCSEEFYYSNAPHVRVEGSPNLDVERRLRRCDGDACWWVNEDGSTPVWGMPKRKP